MSLIDADRLLADRMKSKYYRLPNGDITIPIIDIEHAPDLTRKLQEILDYLDNELHPIVSPEHWYLYADLHDMISALIEGKEE